MSGLPLVNQPETTYVKALRAHVANYIDVRLIVKPDVYSSLRMTAHWSKATAGYEVRRKDLPKPDQSGPGGQGKVHWDNLTVYVVAYLSCNFLLLSSNFHLFSRKTFQYNTAAFLGYLNLSHCSSTLLPPYTLRRESRTSPFCTTIRINLVLFPFAKGLLLSRSQTWKT